MVYGNTILCPLGATSSQRLAAWCWRIGLGRCCMRQDGLWMDLQPVVVSEGAMGLFWPRMWLECYDK